MAPTPEGTLLPPHRHKVTSRGEGMTGPLAFYVHPESPPGTEGLAGATAYAHGHYIDPDTDPTVVSGISFSTEDL